MSTKFSNTHVATITPYLNNCILPLTADSVNTTYLLSIKPQIKLVTILKAKEAILGVIVTKSVIKEMFRKLGITILLPAKM